MCNILKKLRLKLFLKYYRKTHSMSPRGEMMMYYILNKYINNTKPDDFIEDYELSIANDIDRFMNSARLCVTSLPDQFKGEEIEVQAIAHVFSAMHLFEILLIALPDDQRETWFERIENDIMRRKFKESIENKFK